MEDLIPGTELTDNTSQRTACVLVLDCSGSMDGEPIKQLNDGVKVLEEDIKKDPEARTRVQIKVISLGESVEVLTDWTDAIDFTAPELSTSGLTPLGQAMNEALDTIEDQKMNYKSNGISYTRPWLILFTDGAPTDDWRSAATRCRQAVDDGKIIFFPIAVDGADTEVLKQFNSDKKGIMKLSSVNNFKECFQWLSGSIQSASASAPGDKLQLQPPETSSGEAFLSFEV